MDFFLHSIWELNFVLMIRENTEKIGFKYREITGTFLSILLIFILKIETSNEKQPTKSKYFFTIFLLYMY